MASDSIFQFRVPHIGDNLVPRLLDGDTDLTRKGMWSVVAPVAPPRSLLWVTKWPEGDGGDGGAIPSFATTDPQGRPGGTICSHDIIFEGDQGADEAAVTLLLTAIPPGSQGLLPPQFSPATPPTGENFDPSEFYPFITATPCLSPWGDGNQYNSEFPNAPSLPPLPVTAPPNRGIIGYIPPNYYDTFATVFETLLQKYFGGIDFSPTPFTLVDRPQSGLLLAIAEWNQNAAPPNEGTASLVVDYSHSVSN